MFTLACTKIVIKIRIVVIVTVFHEMTVIKTDIMDLVRKAQIFILSLYS